MINMDRHRRSQGRGAHRWPKPKTSRSTASPFKIFKQFIRLVLETSSVHGFNHVAARKRHPFENFLWVFFVIIGAYGAYFFAQSTLGRYRSSPTVISLERNYKDWNTTFPAITLCPSYKIDEGLSEETVRKWFGETSNASEAVDWLKQLASATYDNFDKLTIEDKLPPTQYVEVLRESLYKLKYTVSDSNSASGELSLTVSERGLCYTFNSVVSRYNSPAYWASNNWTLDHSSIKVFKGNPLEGDVFAQVMEMNSGYMVNIHSPYEVPDVSTSYLTSANNIYLSIDVTALATASSEETRELDIKQRKCRFLEESNLETSPVYSYKHCRSECRMKLAHKLCKCVPYFHRPIDGYAICDVKGMKCLGQYKERLIKLKDGMVSEDCKCLPPCNDVTYNVYGTTSTPWYLGTNLKWGLLKYPRTRLKRDLFFTKSDLLVQLGGTASLCLGCSVLSFCEFAYFFTLRLIIFVIQKTRTTQMN